MQLVTNGKFVHKVTHFLPPLPFLCREVLCYQVAPFWVRSLTLWQTYLCVLLRGFVEARVISGKINLSSLSWCWGVVLWWPRPLLMLAVWCFSRESVSTNLWLLSSSCLDILCSVVCCSENWRCMRSISVLCKKSKENDREVVKMHTALTKVFCEAAIPFSVALICDFEVLW